MLVCFDAFIVFQLLLIPSLALINITIQKRIDDASNYFVEGNLAKDEGQLKESLSFYRAAVRLLPNSTDYLMMLGTVEFNLNMKDDALKRFNRVLIFEPNLHTAKQYVRRILNERKTIDNYCLGDICSDESIATPVTTTITELSTSVWVPTSNSFQFSILMKCRIIRLLYGT
jgi:tetratricopeptide (TPR) repeat protein